MPYCHVAELLDAALEEEGGTLIARKVGEAVQNTLGAVVGAIDIPLGEHQIQLPLKKGFLLVHQSCVILCASRPGERCSPPGLLGPRPGHPFLQRVPERVLPSPLHPSLPRLWPGRMWRLLSGAAGRAISRLGPHSEGLQQLQREGRGALATEDAPRKGRN